MKKYLKPLAIAIGGAAILLVIYNRSAKIRSVLGAQ